MNILGTHTLGGTRFTIRGRLGAGNMGIVYEAHDRERDELVALKTLLNAEANALYRFKREFRALADIHHRNLVTLHELFVDDQQCFFTMERVVGVNFLEYVRPETGSPGDDATFEGFDPDAGELSATHIATDDDDEDDEDGEDGEDREVDESRAHPHSGSADGSFVTDATLAFDPSLPPVSLFDASLAHASLAAGDLDPAPARPAIAAAGPGTVDLVHLRGALGQLAEGVVALHQAASSTATSSPATSWSPRTAASSSSTSASPPS